MSRGHRAVGVFLFFAATMASLAGITLLWPHLSLGRIWALNPTAWTQLAPLGWKVGIPFLLLAVLLIFLGIGWMKRRLWAWRFTVIGLALHMLGDLLNAFLRQPWQGATGVLIAGALLFYLFRPNVREVFRQ